MESLNEVRLGTKNISKKVDYEMDKGSNGVSTDEEIPTPEGFNWWTADKHDPIFIKYKSVKTIYGLYYTTLIQQCMNMNSVCIYPISLIYHISKQMTLQTT